jgi:hypothetical protein
MGLGIAHTALEAVMSDVSVAHTILVRAQQTVDRWVKTRRPNPFDDHITATGEGYWGTSRRHVAEREAFRLVAYAILRGRGHAFANPAPLLEITDRVLRYDSPLQAVYAASSAVNPVMSSDGQSSGYQPYG